MKWISNIAVSEKLKEVPKISAIIPCYNAEQYLEKCLGLLVRQTFKNFEIICINDKSEDDANWLINGFFYIGKRIKIINQDNQLLKVRNENLGGI